MSEIIIKPELKYDLEALEFMRGEKYDTFQDFADAVYDQARADITEYLLTCDFDDWCEVYQIDDFEEVA